MSLNALNASHSTYRGFTFYRKDDVATGKGGYAKVTLPNGQKAWGNAGTNLYHGRITVSFLGFGQSPVYELTDFSIEDQQSLRQTIDE